MRALIALVLFAIATTSPAAWLWHLQPSPLRDAALAGLHADVVTNNYFRYRVTPPPGVHTGITLTVWMRIHNPPPHNIDIRLVPFAFWTPDPIKRLNPDLAAGAFGHGVAGGVDLTAAGGAVAVNPFPFAAYAEHPDSAIAFPRGCYTIAGWADNPTTLTLGGKDVTLPAGEFNFNALPGPSSTAVLSGSGRVAIGVSRTPCARYHYESTYESDTSGEGTQSTPESTVGENWKLLTWRWWVAGTNQHCQVTIGGPEGHDTFDKTFSSIAGTCGGLSPEGEYFIGANGPGYPPHFPEIFDWRLFTRRLTDADIRRIHLNGVQELTRRGLLP